MNNNDDDGIIKNNISGVDKYIGRSIDRNKFINKYDDYKDKYEFTMLKVDKLTKFSIELDNNLDNNKKYPNFMCTNPLPNISKDSVIGYFKNINDGIVLIDNLPDKATNKYNDPANLDYLNALTIPTLSNN